MHARRADGRDARGPAGAADEPPALDLVVGTLGVRIDARADRVLLGHRPGPRAAAQSRQPHHRRDLPRADDARDVADRRPERGEHHDLQTGGADGDALRRPRRAARRRALSGRPAAALAAADLMDAADHTLAQRYPWRGGRCRHLRTWTGRALVGRPHGRPGADLALRFQPRGAPRKGRWYAWRLLITSQ